jgi:hypothetical protein
MVSCDRALLRRLGDHVEFVAFRIQQSRPAHAAHLDILLSARTQADQPPDLCLGAISGLTGKPEWARMTNSSALAALAVPGPDLFLILGPWPAIPMVPMRSSAHVGKGVQPGGKDLRPTSRSRSACG